MEHPFEVIYHLDDTFVIRKGPQVYKLLPECEWKCYEARLGYLERLYPNRFCVWKRCHDLALCKKLTNLCGTLDPCVLLNSKFIGPNCNSFNKRDNFMYKRATREFKMDATHGPVFLRHLRESVHILSSEGVVHGDLAMRNIVFCPNKTESTTGIITQALPVIIDFGMAFFDAENALKYNTSQWVSMCQFEAHQFNPLFVNVDPFAE